MLKSSKPTPAQAGERHGGHRGPRSSRGYGRGETSEGCKPMDGTGTKQGRKTGCGRKRRGSEKLRGRREVGKVSPARYGDETQVESASGRCICSNVEGHGNSRRRATCEGHREVDDTGSEPEPRGEGDEYHGREPWTGASQEQIAPGKTPNVRARTG